MSRDFDKTMQFSLNNKEKDTVSEILSNVYTALEEKGYNPNNQIIGYLLSGDPTYITSHNNARKQITQLDRNDLLENILNFYLEEKGINK